MAEDPYSDGGVNPQAITPWVATSTKGFRRAAYTDSGAALVSSSPVVPDSVLNKVITVNDTRDQIVAANANRSTLVIKNQGSDTFYIGNASVISGASADPAGGLAIAANGSITYDGLDAGLAYYGITAAAGSTLVAVVETVEA